VIFRSFPVSSCGGGHPGDSLQQAVVVASQHIAGLHRLSDEVIAGGGLWLGAEQGERLGGHQNPRPLAKAGRASQRGRLQQRAWQHRPAAGLVTKVGQDQDGARPAGAGNHPGRLPPHALVEGI